MKELCFECSLRDTLERTPKVISTQNFSHGKPYPAPPPPPPPPPPLLLLEVGD